MTDRDDWLARFPPLMRLEPDARRRLCEAARAVKVPPGTRVFQEGSACQNYMLVIDGSVRVQKVSENGREIVLYRVETGQSCVLTTNCLLTREEYGAEGIAENPVNAIVLPATAFEDLLARSAEFRRFVFSSYAARISDLLMLIEEVAFGRIDVRLAQVLADRAGTGEIAVTHHDLAVELGTAREVVSRQLKDFERRGWVELKRGRIAVKDREALRSLVGRG